MKRKIWIGSLLLGVALSARAQTLVMLHSFSGADGSGPTGALVFGPSGNLYGTTTSGGASGDGTVFSVTRGGQFTLLHSFSGTDGAEPFGALLYASDGNLYGTTNTGGTANQGVIFRISGTGQFTVLHNFAGFDGANPYGAMIESTANEGYGLCAGGGQYGYGVIYRIDGGGNYSVVHNFDYTDGANPYGALLSLGGTTYVGQTRQGGTNNNGAAFFLDTSTGELTDSVQFAGSYYHSYGAFVQGPDNVYYNTTYAGGQGYGSVYAMDDQLNLSTLFYFSASTGGEPFAGVIVGTDGNFYGVNTGGGLYPTVPYGAVFQITPAGAQQNIHVFKKTDGADPIGGIVQGPNAGRNQVFYGTTYSGGLQDKGVVYAVTVSPPTTILLVPATQSESVGANASFTVTVSGTSGIPPTGTVNFYSGTELVGSAVLTGSTASGSTATFSAATSGIPAGTYPVYAQYQGDANNAPSSSSSVSVTVQ